MKFSAIALIVFQAVYTAAVDDQWWNNYVDSVSSFPPPTPQPTPPPTPGPTPPPAPGPTPGPTLPPTPGPTPPPTPGPTRPPTLPPTPGPSPPPTPGPTLAPTGSCSIDSGLNCTAIMDGEQITCEEITPEDEPVCECEDCVREVKFKYTGLPCSSGFSASGKCADDSPNPFVAGYRITDCEDSTQVFATGQAEQGDYVTIGASNGACLPACMNVVISIPTGAVTQTFEIDSTCGGVDRGLVLVSDYGAFQSIGYSCSESDTHNCIQDISYGLKVCNTGTTDEQCNEWSFTLNKERIDLLQGLEDAKLDQGECIYDTYNTEVDRCNELESCVNITASATDPETGLPPLCFDEEEMKFGWDQPQTPPPTPPPSPPPSPAPSPAPTSSCVIDISLTGCPRYNSSLDNNCDGRPQVITFRYNGGGCSQSDNLQPRQKFSCADENGGPPLVQGTPNYIIAFPTGGSDLYFSGPVAVGEKYTLNQNLEFDKLSADMSIQIFDSEGGNLLEQVDVHLSCSQPLFLFDKFGASQVTEWIETSGRIVSDKQTDVQTGTIEVKLDTASDIIKPIRLLEMTVLTNTQEEPIDYTSQIAGVVLGPGDVIELDGFGIDIELTERTRYTFFTTLIGETLDGTNQCNGFDFLECTIGFNLNPVFPTLVPTPNPTITPFPTLDPKNAACEVSTDISCTVKSLEGISCDQIKAPAGETCPDDAELLVAYLKYDGSLGDSIFLEIVCDKSTTYIDRVIEQDETFQFRTRSNSCEEVEFIVYTSDPNIDGSFLQQNTVSTSCPGPWTLGARIADVFSLDAFVDTKDDGISFDLHIDEVEVQLDYTVVNNGQFPLTVISGEISDIYIGSDTGIGGSIALEGLPITLAPRSQQVFQSNTEVVKMAGRSGDVATYSFSVGAETRNQFALPCSDETSQTLEL